MTIYFQNMYSSVPDLANLPVKLNSMVLILPLLYADAPSLSITINQPCLPITHALFRVFRVALFYFTLSQSLPIVNRHSFSIVHFRRFFVSVARNTFIVVVCRNSVHVRRVFAEPIKTPETRFAFAKCLQNQLKLQKLGSRLPSVYITNQNSRNSVRVRRVFT